MVLLRLRKICRPYPADPIHKGLSRATRDSQRPASGRFPRNPGRESTEGYPNRFWRHQISSAVGGQGTVQNPARRQRPVERVRGLARQDRHCRRRSDSCRRVLSEFSRPTKAKRYSTGSAVVRKVWGSTPPRSKTLHQMWLSIRLNRLSDMSNYESHGGKVLQELREQDRVGSLRIIYSERNRPGKNWSSKSAKETDRIKTPSQFRTDCPTGKLDRIQI